MLYRRLGTSARAGDDGVQEALSVLSGAIASLAATRSRALWLRTSLARAELFARVEAAFWRCNTYALGVLLVMFVVLRTSIDAPTKMLVLGLGLLMLGTTLSTISG